VLCGYRNEPVTSLQLATSAEALEPRHAGPYGTPALQLATNTTCEVLRTTEISQLSIPDMPWIIAASTRATGWCSILIFVMFSGTGGVVAVTMEMLRTLAIMGQVVAMCKKEPELS
jgi:hypothetical protein